MIRLRLVSDSDYERAHMQYHGVVLRLLRDGSLFVTTNTFRSDPDISDPGSGSAEVCALRSALQVFFLNINIQV